MSGDKKGGGVCRICRKNLAYSSGIHYIFREIRSITGGRQARRSADEMKHSLLGLKHSPLRVKHSALAPKHSPPEPKHSPLALKHLPLRVKQSLPALEHSAAGEGVRRCSIKHQSQSKKTKEENHL